MHWTHYTWRLVEALAWPAVVISVILLFRAQLGEVASRLQEFTYGRTKLKFGKALEDAHKESENLPVRADKNQIPDLDHNFLNLAKDHPEAAVLEAYKHVERFLVETAGEYHDLRTKNPLKLAQQLYSEGFLDAGAAALVEKVRNVRDIAIHANTKTITSNEALAYRCLCDEVIHKLKDAFERANAARTVKNSSNVRADDKPAV